MDRRSSNAAACLFVKCNYLFFQEDMFLCSANCYKDRISPIEDLHSCTERCNIKLEENKDFFQRELDSVEVKEHVEAKGAVIKKKFVITKVYFLLPTGHM